MPASAHALRLQIETALQSRIASALTPRPRILRDLQATGIGELDTLLEGGLPIGAISELVGPACSGRTTLAMATLAEITQAGTTVAWIDATDSLDPESAAAAGVDLAKQLWVRCGHDPHAALPPTPEPQETNGPALLVEGSCTPVPSGGCGSPHPRSEVRGLSQAVDAFLQPDVFSRPAPPRDPAVSRRNRWIGTPSAPNRPLLPGHSSSQPLPRASLDRVPQDPRPFPRRSPDREEQIPTDRQPTRRQVLYARQYAASPAPKSLQAAQIANTAAAAGRRREGPPQGAWTDNGNNAAGRSLATAPNAIAAGLPRFQEMEARANGQSPQDARTPLVWKPETKPVLPVPAASLAGSPPPSGKSQLWRALDQALRSTDLLLAAGGFGAIVLDLGHVPPEFAWRIPLATWFRFRAGADRARTILLLLTQHPCARSSAELVMRLSPAEPADAGTVLTGTVFRVAVERRRFDSQPDAPTLKETTPSPHISSMSQPPAQQAAVVGKIHLVPLHKPVARKPAQRETVWPRTAAWASSAAGSGLPFSKSGRP